MKIEIEISQIDRKHEAHRLQSASREKELFTSIIERGIEEPLQGVQEENRPAILLDGFKRLRCAEKLRRGTVPFFAIGTDEAEAILQMIRSSNAKALTLLEQAAFVEDLRKSHGLRVEEIARRLQKSKAWVVVRLKTLSEMSKKTQESILSGKFPFSSYFYTLHPVRRLTNGTSQQEVDEFVGLVAGKGLSTRDIEIVADAYFRGGDVMRNQLKNGDLGWTLQELKDRKRSQLQTAGINEAEQKILKDMEIVHGCMGRLTLRLVKHEIADQKGFVAQAEVICGGILSRTKQFDEVLRGFYDRIRQA
jgi:ParB/RepB/Spo0J family partition protein